MPDLIRTLLAVGAAATLLAGCTPDPADDDDSVVGDDDDGVECDNNVCVLSGTITGNTTLTSDVNWLLRGGVFVGDDINETVLTIEPGTTVYGESSTDGMLVVRRNSKLVAEGTADAPIVFTSDKAEGSRSRGDWGGLIINGNAQLNIGDCATDEGEAFGEGGTGWYGGCDDSDDSGVLRYVRVEFAGTLISPDNELNGIAFQGVGSSTTIDYVQVHMNADDGVEFFGGAAEAKHLVLTGIGDDCLDWTDGWRGKAQFVVGQQYADSANNGIEADNSGDNNDAVPRSNPTLSNLTLLGAPSGGDTASDIGMLLREGTAANISNVIVAGFNDACLDVDHDATFAMVDSGDLTLTNVLLDCDTSFDEEAEDPTLVGDWFSGQTGNSEADPMLGDAFNQSTPDWAPAAGSPALGAGSAPADSFFDAADFIGAIGSDDWTAGWTTAAQD